VPTVTVLVSSVGNRRLKPYKNEDIKKNDAEIDIS